MSIIENLLDDAGVDPEEVASEGARDSINGSVGRSSEIDVGNVKPPSPETTFDLPSFGKDQFELLTSVDLTRGNPNTGERESVFRVGITAEDGSGSLLDGESASLGVSATNHLGTIPFDDAPNNGLDGNTTVEFDSGEGSFTIGGADSDDADLTLGFFGFLPKVNDVETIEISPPEGVEIVDRTLELKVSSGSALDVSLDSTAVDGEFTDVIEE